MTDYQRWLKPGTVIMCSQGGVAYNYAALDQLAQALAQAERERDEARAERNARARDVMHLGAETERLRAALRVVHQECREDRGEEDKHALAVRMMRLIETALEGRG